MSDSVPEGHEGVFRKIGRVIDEGGKSFNAKGKLIGGLLGISIAAGYAYWEEFKRGPLMDTPISQALLADRGRYAGESCDEEVARNHFPELQGKKFSCRCVFFILIDKQVALDQLASSEQRSSIAYQAQSECVDD